MTGEPFEECAEAFTNAASEYAQKRHAVTGEDLGHLYARVGSAMVGIGCNFICSALKLGPDVAIAETQKFFASIAKYGPVKTSAESENDNE